MINRLPFSLSLDDSIHICVICEGNEEYTYLSRLIDLKVWNYSYRFTLVNAEGNGNLFARYQDRFQDGSYDLVLIFCDTERKNRTDVFQNLKHKINVYHDVENIADKLVIYGNPCTLQIVIKHWCNEVITSVSKSNNAPLLEQLTGIQGYKARKDQLEALTKQINTSNYLDMKERISKYNQNELDIGSTNFL